MFRSGVDSLGGFVAIGDKNTVRVSKCPTRSEFYERFHKGSRYRMGMDTKQDYALTSDSLRALLRLLDEVWEAAESDEERHFTEDLAIFTIC